MMNELQVDGRSAPNWKTLPLGSFVTFQRGYDLPHRMRRAGGIPLVSSAGITDFHNVAMVNGPGVVTGRYGTIGKLFYVEEPFWPLNTTLYVRDFQGNLPKYAYYLLQRFDFHSFSGKSGVPGVNRNDLHSETVKISTDLEEQSAIATALSDVDALIAGLEKLIAKKRDLKQAVMQQLLTGQTRLPGFSGAWSVKRLGDHFSTLKNGVNSRAELSVEGGVAYLHYGDIHGSKSLFLNPHKTTMPTLPLAKAKDLDRLQSGDLVFADASENLDGVGKSVEVQGSDVLDLVSGQHTIAIRFDKTVLADGFKAYLQFFPAFSAHLCKLAAGTKVYATNRSHIASAEIKLPEVDEQRAIASILQSMNAELSSIETRLSKVRQLKQGMMQELLTGRSRLI